MAKALGFAIRRSQGCEPAEIPCNSTWTEDPYVACCANGGFCHKEGGKGGSENIYCCATSDRLCKDRLDKEPRCSHPSWGMFEHDGRFCCREDYLGFYDSEEEDVGCMAHKDDLTGSQQLLAAVDQENVGEGRQTKAPSPTPTPKPPDDDAKETPVGAIAGGTVGGVAGLAIILAAAWWFLKRRKRKAADAAENTSAEAAPKEKPATPPPRELEGGPGASELEGPRVVSELPGQQGVSELPG